MFCSTTMSNKPSIKISGGKSDFLKKERKKPLYSNFLITINTNQVYGDSDEFLSNDSDFFEDKIKEMLSDLPNFLKVDEWSSDKIHDVNVDYVLERGGKKNQLHAHVLIKIKHNTKVQVDYSKMKTFVQDALGLKGIYFNCRLVRPSSDQFLLDYIDKMK